MTDAEKKRRSEYDAEKQAQRQLDNPFRAKWQSEYEAKTCNRTEAGLSFALGPLVPPGARLKGWDDSERLGWGLGWIIFVDTSATADELARFYYDLMPTGLSFVPPGGVGSYAPARELPKGWSSFRSNPERYDDGRLVVVSYHTIAVGKLAVSIRTTLNPASEDRLFLPVLDPPPPRIPSFVAGDDNTSSVRMAKYREEVIRFRKSIELRAPANLGESWYPSAQVEAAQYYWLQELPAVTLISTDPFPKVCAYYDVHCGCLFPDHNGRRAYGWCGTDRNRVVLVSPDTSGTRIALFAPDRAPFNSRVDAPPTPVHDKTTSGEVD